MEAIILAGGFGTRLKNVVSDLPKPMAPVAGMPFLEILLLSLSQKGFNKVILSLGYMADKITSYFGHSYKGLKLVYEIEREPLGTGGAVRHAMIHCSSDHVFVFNGDTFIDLEISELEEKWQNNKTSIIVARKVPDTLRYGRLDDIDGKVYGFSEKGVAGEGLINAGCYVLPVSALEAYPSGKNFSLEIDYLARIVKKNPFDMFITKGYFIDIGIPDDYKRAQIELKNFVHI